MLTTRLSRTIGVLAIALAAAGGAAAVSGGASETPDRHTRVLRFVLGPPNERHELFHHNGGPGDRIIQRDGLYRGGRRRGVLLSVFTLTGRNGGGIGQDVAILRHHRIFMDSAERDSFEAGNEPEAIVGGTGPYRLARGIGVVDVTGTRNIVRLRFTRP